MDKSQSQPGQPDRINERGAALIITLLVATALLVAGGALIQITSRSARNTIDSTAETQAYYAAEAGLNVALNMLRRSPQSNPVGTQATFRNAVNNPSLSPWLNYNTTVSGHSAVSLGNFAYSIVVSEPVSTATPSTQEPTRVLIQATGYGPNGAMKQMSMMVAKNAFDPRIPAMLTPVNGTSSAMHFNEGQSAPHVYKGTDHAGLVSALPTFSVSNQTDYNHVETASDSQPAAALLTPSTTPSYLQSPAETRKFLTLMQALAMDGQARKDAGETVDTATYLPNGGQGIPTGFTFVKGDYTMSPGSGSGLLIITGDLTTNGAANFDGVILVLGSGVVNRNGGGGGAFYGATFIANVDWPAQSPALDTFGTPYFDFNGGGNATMQYDSVAVANAFKTLPSPVLGISEY
jgi:Tfp pilus assembly protein PilX